MPNNSFLPQLVTANNVFLLKGTQIGHAGKLRENATFMEQSTVTNIPVEFRSLGFTNKQIYAKIVFDPTHLHFDLNGLSRGPPNLYSHMAKAPLRRHMGSHGFLNVRNF